MKKTFSLITYIFICIAIVFPSASRAIMPEIGKTTEEGLKLTRGIYIFSERAVNLTGENADKLLQDYLVKTGFFEDAKIVFLKEKEDDLGIRHIYGQQVIRNIPVDGAQVVLSIRGLQAIRISGHYFKNLEVSFETKISAEQAIGKAKAKAKIPDQYLIKEPKSREIIKVFKGKAYLCHHVPVHAATTRLEVYVDAMTGEILYQNDSVRYLSFCADGTGSILGTDERGDLTKSFGIYKNKNFYELWDAKRSNCVVSQKSIHTLSSYIIGDNIYGRSVTSLSKTFNGSTDSTPHKVFNTPHYYLGVAIDWLKNTYNIDTWNGLQDDHRIFQMRANQNYNNAMWLGNGDILIGDGSADIGWNIQPLGQIDVIGHEYIGHGLFDGFTIGNPYSGESGAVEEAFADACGVVLEIEFELNDGDQNTNGDWLIGEDLIIAGGAPYPNPAIRNLANPKAQGDPDTYKGEYWDFVTEEVHKNCTPLGHCFYLMSEGGSGINDKGDNYEVTGIGILSAHNIALRAMRYYITSSVDYQQWIDALRSAAHDLYGEASLEDQAVTNAVHAIGCRFSSESLCDFDNDGYDKMDVTCGGNDCDDANPGINPGAAEVCDGLDNDCNGEADEDYVLTPTSCGVGACAATGVTACVNGVEESNCIPGAPAANDAGCDGIDNDCNGEADEDYVLTPTSCGGLGACAATGTIDCVNGLEIDSCTPGTPAANDAGCDGIDNDCNGETDEDYVLTPTSCGVGACAATGVTACVNGVEESNCIPGAPAANDAGCDGIDNDCNGETDEDYVLTSTSCGVGACAATGVRQCLDGQVVDTCSPGTPVTELCNDGIDNDCDGYIDAIDSNCGIFYDSFEVSEWNDNWTEDFQNDWFISSSRAFQGNFSAEIDGVALNARLTSSVINNLQGTVTITFSWYIDDDLDSGEYLAFDVSINGGKWVEKAKLAGADGIGTQENLWRTQIITLALINNSTIRIQFRGKMSDSIEFGNVDEVRVIAQ